MSKLRKHILLLIEKSGCEILIRRFITAFKPGKNGEYDRLTLKLIRSLPTNANCLDIGLYKGEFGIEIAKRCLQGDHHFFEASLQTFTIAKKFFINFPNINVHHKAVFNKTQLMEFTYVTERPARSSLRPNSFVQEMEKVTNQVMAIDIDSYLPNFKADFIKIDIEGAELFALEGAKETIIRSQPIIVFESLESMIVEFDKTGQDIYDFFEKINYQINTLVRYFADQNALSLNSFLSLYAKDKEFFFIAIPKK